MRTADWVRPALRAIGILLVGLALPSFLRTMTSVLEFALASGSFWSDPRGISAWISSWFVGSSQMIFGLYLVFGGNAVTRWCLRGADGLCPRCGYQTEGTIGERCPECGLKLRPAEARAGDAEAKVDTPKVE